ncbi:MAG: MarR family transcriptional regulator [Nevskia sp.]|nr:MarR family transcriptional regulator [Nevskia sp.]
MSQPYYRAETYTVRSSVGYLIKRSHALILEALEPGLAAHDLTYMQFSVLMSLRDRIALNSRDICSLLRHDSGALTRVLDQLERRALIERQRSTADRRAVELRLTERGRSTVAGLVPMVVDTLNRELGGFSHAEIDELLRLLNKLISGMQDRAGGAAGA